MAQKKQTEPTLKVVVIGLLKAPGKGGKSGAPYPVGAAITLPESKALRLIEHGVCAPEGKGPRPAPKDPRIDELEAELKTANARLAVLDAAMKTADVSFDDLIAQLAPPAA